MCRRTGALQWILGSLAIAAGAGTPACSSEQMFDVIPAKNVFRLRAPPRVLPTPAPLPQVTLLGIMTFGGKRAALKVERPGKSGEPAPAQYHILAEGESAGGVAVLAIDETARRVSVNNEGKFQVLEFQLAPTR